jgi:hypothetical protein
MRSVSAHITQSLKEVDQMYKRIVVGLIVAFVVAAAIAAGGAGAAVASQAVQLQVRRPR